jgi:hypothetical protein
MRAFLFLIVAGVLLALLTDEAVAVPPEIWFAPLDWIIRPLPGGPISGASQSDFGRLFDQPPPAVMSRVAVFKLYPQLVAQASDDDLRQFFEGLKRQNISLGLEAGLLTTTDKCGRGVEGYGGQGAARLADRIAKLGGNLTYIAMDEPAWFGHEFSGTDACHASLTDIAADVAKNIAAVRTIFPNAQVGDIEPVTFSANDSLVHHYVEWIDAYRRAVGEPLAFFHADVVWDKPWLTAVEELVRDLEGKEIPFGMIYNGNGDAPTDKIWIDEAEAHYTAYEADGRNAPDQVIFQSWLAHPSHLLPDTDTGAFTYLIRRYFRPRTQIAAEVARSAISGRLSDDSDKPIANGKIAVAGIDDTGPGSLAQASLTGVVPSRARRAAFGLRLNTECECSGTADVTLGTLHYDETRAGAVQYAFAPTRDLWRQGAASPSATGSVNAGLHIEAATGHPVLDNSPPFTVTPDAGFIIHVPWRVSTASVGSGYLALIFFDETGKEIRRDKLPLEPSWTSLGTANTGPDGRFRLALRGIGTAGRIKLSYPGNETFRATSNIVAGAVGQER